MIVVSNNLREKTNLVFNKDAVMRVNLAWMKDREDAKNVIDMIGASHAIYLDYPQGRTKPPKPVITLEEAIDIANTMGNIRYFAVSNVEDSQSLNHIKRQIRKDIEIVPKIETDAGVRNLDVIFKNIAIKYVMLDKEDLYLDVDRDGKMYEELVEMVRRKCKENKVELLELQGVIFT